jgi:hypothetical protein
MRDKEREKKKTEIPVAPAFVLRALVDSWLVAGGPLVVPWWLGFPTCGALHAVDLWRFGPLVDRGP